MWALDVKRCVYVRDGVSAEFPCGKNWKLIPGNGFSLCNAANWKAEAQECQLMHLVCKYALHVGLVQKPVQFTVFVSVAR